MEDNDSISNVLEDAKAQLRKVKDWEEKLQHASQRFMDKENAVNLDEASEKYQLLRDQYNLIQFVKLFYKSSKGKTFNCPVVPRNHDYEQAHLDELTKMNLVMQRLSSTCNNLQENAYLDALRQNRLDLELVIESLEHEEQRNLQVQHQTDQSSYAPTLREVLDVENDTSLASDNSAESQSRLEALERRKKQLQQELAAIQEQNRDADKLCRERSEELKRLRELSADSGINSSNEEVLREISQLREVKDFYDSMKRVTEELGGLKIVDTKERKSDNRLLLTIELYGEYQIQIQLETIPRRIKEFKLVGAHWITSRHVSVEEKVGRAIVPVEGEDPTDVDKQAELPLRLVLPELDDLVEVAHMSIPPGDDLRFLLREAMGRIRVMKSRVSELNTLRRRVLTNVVGESGEQIVCSFNEGILVCFRLYEGYVVVEKVMGVGGWDQEIIAQLESDLKRLAHTDHQCTQYGAESSKTFTSTVLVDKIQWQIDKWKSEGTVVFPKTPRLPNKQHRGFF